MKYTQTDLTLAVNHLAFDMFYFRLYAERYPQYQSNGEHRACDQAMIYALLLHRWTENAPSMNYYAARFNDVLVLIQRFAAALPGEVGQYFAARMNFWDEQYDHL